MENIEDIDISTSLIMRDSTQMALHTLNKAHRTKITVATGADLEKKYQRTLKEEEEWIDDQLARGGNLCKLRKEEAGAILWVSCLRPQILLKEIKSFIETSASRHISL